MATSPILVIYTLDEQNDGFLFKDDPREGQDDQTD